MNKTVLVTGANGFIGTQVVKKLKENGWHVLSAVRKAKQANEVELDLTNGNFHERLREIQKPNAIIHLGAKVVFNGEPLEEIYPANVQATSLLIKLAEEWNAKFVFASSVLVAGINQSNNNTSSEKSPWFSYVESKLLAENIINASGIDATILRIGGVFGLSGPSHLSLNKAIDNVCNQQRPIQIGQGLAKRNYLYVKDAAAIIASTLEQNVTGTHLVAGAETLSISEMLNNLCKTFIPGQTPLIQSGQEASDQIIKLSPSLSGFYSFHEAVQDMFIELNQ